MSSLDEFAASAARMVAAHGGDDGFAVTVYDPNATDDLETGDQNPSERAWTVPCTFPTDYSPGMVDGAGILAGDANVFVEATRAEITFAPEPGMFATITGPAMPEFGTRYSIVRAPRLAGSFELHLRDGAPAPEPPEEP